MKEKKISINYRSYSSKIELPTQLLELVEKAKKASEIAYAPYSKFNVGAALLLENGEVLTSNNQENAAFPSGLCAERVALFYHGANFSKIPIHVMAIYAPSDRTVSPCGSCRQVMAETEKRNKTQIKLLVCSEKEEVIEFDSFLDILPFPFIEF